jgi:hypothetical protein
MTKAFPENGEANKGGLSEVFGHTVVRPLTIFLFFSQRTEISLEAIGMVEAPNPRRAIDRA